jgi:hypothetical protein
MMKRHELWSQQVYLHNWQVLYILSYYTEWLSCGTVYVFEARINQWERGIFQLKMWMLLICRCYVFFSENQVAECQIFDCHFTKNRPHTIISKHQMFDRPNVRQTKCSTSHFTKPSIVRITNFQMYNIFEQLWVILSWLDLTNLT